MSAIAHQPSPPAPGTYTKAIGTLTTTWGLQNHHGHRTIAMQGARWFSPVFGPQGLRGLRSLCQDVGCNKICWVTQTALFWVTQIPSIPSKDSRKQGESSNSLLLKWEDWKVDCFSTSLASRAAATWWHGDFDCCAVKCLGWTTIFTSSSSSEKRNTCNTYCIVFHVLCSKRVFVVLSFEICHVVKQSVVQFSHTLTKHIELPTGDKPARSSMKHSGFSEKWFGSCQTKQLAQAFLQLPFKVVLSFVSQQASSFPSLKRDNHQHATILKASQFLNPYMT